MIPIVAILVKPVTDAMHRTERAEARRSYERIALEKLEVIKTALAMGYAADDLKDLDARLEQLVGADKLQSLLDTKRPATPEAPPALRDTDLEAELQRLRTARKETEGRG